MSQKLSVGILTRELLVHLVRAFDDPSRPTPLPAHVTFLRDKPRPHQYTIEIWLTPDDLTSCLDRVAETVIKPVAERWARDLPAQSGKVCVELKRPLGYDSAWEVFGGYGVRGILVDDVPVDPLTGRWFEVKRYYNIGTDEFKTGPCGILLRFDMLLADAPKRDLQTYDEEAGLRPLPVRAKPEPPKEHVYRDYLSKLWK